MLFRSIVSHDRYFLDRTCTSILEIGDESPPLYSSGNYTQFQALKAARPSATQNKIETLSSDPKKNRENRKRYFGFKEARELKALEIDIASMEAKVRDIQKRLEEPLSPDEYHGVSQELGDTNESLEKAYHRWEELESLKAVQN